VKVKRDDGTEIDVEWGVEEHSSPGNGWDDDGHGSVVYLTEATTLDGEVDVLADLSDAEKDRIEIECAEAQNEIDCEPYDPEPYE
jgi:hypothetical protein